MMAFVAGAVAMPVLGRLVDRFGFRRIVLVCVPGLALVYLLIALTARATTRSTWRWRVRRLSSARAPPGSPTLVP